MPSNIYDGGGGGADGTYVGWVLSHIVFITLRELVSKISVPYINSYL